MNQIWFIERKGSYCILQCYKKLNLKQNQVFIQKSKVNQLKPKKLIITKKWSLIFFCLFVFNNFGFFSIFDFFVCFFSDHCFKNNKKSSDKKVGFWTKQTKQSWKKKKQNQQRKSFMRYALLWTNCQCRYIYNRF